MANTVAHILPSRYKKEQVFSINALKIYLYSSMWQEAYGCNWQLICTYLYVRTWRYYYISFALIFSILCLKLNLPWLHSTTRSIVNVAKAYGLMRQKPHKYHWHLILLCSFFTWASFTRYQSQGILT